ncbi:MAG: 3D domain-containing protein [Firmicutes bacterium]|nr:3D domain-containing protein [Bacillota bacterium]
MLFLVAVMATFLLLADEAFLMARPETKPEAKPLETAAGGAREPHEPRIRQPEVSRTTFRRQTRMMLVTAYTAGKESTGKEPGDPGYGLTTSEEPVHVGCIAADPSIPFGTWIYVPGYGWGVVKDRGGDIKGNRLDVYIPNLKEALEWGRQTLPCVLEYPVEQS